MPERDVTTPYRAVRSYMQSLEPVERGAIRRYTRSLWENGNSAFRRGDFDALVTVPALVTEETGIAQTLEFIRKQDVNKGVLISANFPIGGSRFDIIGPNIKGLVAYREHFSDLPLSFYFAPSVVGLPIGSIVRDLSAVGAYFLALTHGEKLRNIPMIRMDADPRYIPDTYLPQIMDIWGEDTEPNKFVYPLVQHDRLDPVKFPNINRLLNWYDLYQQVDMTIVSAHFAVDLQGYAASGGYPPEVVISEVMDVRRKMKQTKELPKLRTYFLGDEPVVVSSRRLAKRSVVESCMEYDSLYMSSDDYATHRTEPPTQDISDLEYRRQVGYIIYNTVQLCGDRIYLTSVNSGVPADNAKELAETSMKEFGYRALEAFGDPAVMQKVVEGAIKNWRHSGPPAGKERKIALPKIRKRIPDPSAGGEGILFRQYHDNL